MNKLPEKARVGRMAVDVLAVAVVWNVLLLVMDYPREDWVGVVAVGYIAFWAARAVVSYAFVRITRDWRRRFRGLVESWGVEIPESAMSVKSLPLEIKLRVLVVVLSLVCGFTAVSVILTSVVIGFASLAPLASVTVPTAAVVAVVGFGITAWQIGNMYFMLRRRQRQLNPEEIHWHGQYVSRLGRMVAGISL